MLREIFLVDQISSWMKKKVKQALQVEGLLEFPYYSKDIRSQMKYNNFCEEDFCCALLRYCDANIDLMLEIM